MKRLIAILALAALLAPAASFAASTICSSNPCKESEVGPFMAGISKQCGNDGTCTLVDIETVFANTGNYVLGVVGALVLLAYVVGGFYFLISGMPGMEKHREKGKTAIRLSTVGLIIVFAAYVGIQTLKSALTGGDINAGYVACGPGDVNEGLACNLNSKCSAGGKCVSECEQRNVNSKSYKTTMTVGVGIEVPAQLIENVYTCVDVNNKNNYGMPNTWMYVSGPEPNLCPGAGDIQCVNFTINVE